MGEVIEFPTGRRITHGAVPHAAAEPHPATRTASAPAAPAAPAALPSGHQAAPAPDAAEHPVAPAAPTQAPLAAPDAPAVPTLPTAPRTPTQVTPSAPTRPTPSAPTRATPSAPSRDTSPPRRRPLLWREAAGHALRAERHGQERTLADVAESAGVSTQYLSEVERGRKEPSSEVLEAIGGALGLDLADLTHRVAHSLRPGSPTATLRAA